MLDNYADPNFKTSKLEMTALHWAAYHGDQNVVEELIENGAEQIFNT